MKSKYLHQALINEGMPCRAQVTVRALCNKIINNKIFACSVTSVECKRHLECNCARRRGK